MPEQRGRCRPGRMNRAVIATAIVALTLLGGSCGRSGRSEVQTSGPAALRIGVGQVSTTNPAMGLRQLNQLLTFEGLARTGEDGRMQPWLAESWTPGKDGRTLTIKIRPNVVFHDGSPLDAKGLATILPGVLRSMLGPVFSDFDSVIPVDNSSVQIQFRQPSPFLLESLDATIQKSGAIGTGP